MSGPEPKKEPKGEINELRVVSSVGQKDA